MELRQPLRDGTPRRDASSSSVGRSRRSRIFTVCDLCCDPACRLCPVGCCLCLLVAANVQLIAWRLLVRCGPSHEHFEWGHVIPNSTMAQVKSSMDEMWYSLEVRAENDTDTGRWWVVDSAVGFYTHFLYQDLQISSQPMALEAWRHSYIFASDHVEMRMCSGSNARFFIDVGYYHRREDVLDYHYEMIVTDSHGRHVATSRKVEGPAWRAVVQSPSGELIATIRRQRTSSEVLDPDDYDYAEDGWSAENLRPELLPNEVVSLLQALYVVNLSNKLANERDEQHVTVSSR